MGAAISLPIMIWLSDGPPELLLISGLIAGLIILKHRGNISRLAQGQEKSWKNGKDDKTG
jgi:glycerol-3-phosphate acyltransferase PlsY